MRQKVDKKVMETCEYMGHDFFFNIMKLNLLTCKKNQYVSDSPDSDFLGSLL